MADDKTTPDDEASKGQPHADLIRDAREQVESIEVTEGTQSLRDAADAERSTSTEPIPKQIGPYKILEVLGEGGMGTVYLAEQDQPVRRRVALKLIKAGMDTKQVIARFEAEQQALALMNHPGIAKVFDVGTTEQGRPYFTMEHVPGIRITDYCDKQRLTTKERLELFVQVCGAVQHAHQKAVIHRDIKPSNILVTIQDGKPVPKIIDFGVAKATQQRLTERTLFTEQGQLVGTPEYMSPEQAEMTALDIDTRTDIYSLGVILYELLAGTLPFEPTTLRRAGFAEIKRIIREDEPPKPSTKLSSLGDESTNIARRRHTDRTSLAKQLRGDLDWITLKAMEKDRTRRYVSAAALAEDIARHLGNEPVNATPPSTVYRLRKFVRRNRWPVATTATILLLLIIGSITSTHLYVLSQRRLNEVEQAREVAVRARTEAELKTYKASLAAAAGDLRRNDPRSVRHTLEQVPSNSRGWETTFLSNSADRSLGNLITLPSRPEGYEMFLNPDATLLAARERGSSASTFTIYDVRTATPLHTFVTGRCRYAHITFSEAGDFLAFDADNNISLRVFSLRTEASVTLPKGKYDKCLAFSPDGRLAVLTELTTSIPRTMRVVLVSTSDWKELATLAEHSDFASGTFTRDGAVFVYVSGSGTQDLQVFNVAAREQMDTLALPGKFSGVPYRLRFSTDGRYLAALSDRSLYVYAWPDRSLLYTLQIQRMTFTSGRRRSDIHFLAMSNGPILLHSDSGGRLYWRAAGSGTLLYTGLGRNETPTSIGFDTDTSEIITAHPNGVVTRWEAVRSRGVVGLPIPADALAFDSTGTILYVGAVANSTDTSSLVAIYDVLHGHLIGDLRSFPVTFGHGITPSMLALSPDAMKLAVTSDTGWNQTRLKIFDLFSGATEYETDEYGCTFTAVAWSDDGKFLVVGDNAGTLRVHRGSNYQNIHRLSISGETAHDLCFIPGSHLVAVGSDDGHVRIVNIDKGEVSHTLSVPGGIAVTKVAVSHDGLRLAAGTNGGWIVVWNLQSFARLVTIRVHTRSITGLEFLDDDSRLLSTSRDKSLRVYSTRNWQEFLSWRFEYEIRALAVDPKGQQAAVSLENGTIQVLDSMAETERAAARRRNRRAEELVKNRMSQFSDSPIDRIARSLRRDWLACTNDEQRHATFVEYWRVLTKRLESAYDLTTCNTIAWPLVRTYILKNLIIVRSLGGDYAPLDPVYKGIQHLSGLDVVQRQAAAEYASALRWCPWCGGKDPGEHTGYLAREIVTAGDSTTDEYVMAYFASLELNDAVPRKTGFLLTLGAAQYRVGLFDDALKTLSDLDGLSNDDDKDDDVYRMAFLAMVRHAIGQQVEGVDDLRHLETTYAKTDSSEGAIASLVREAKETLAEPARAHSVEADVRATLQKRYTELGIGHPKDPEALVQLAKRRDQQSRHKEAVELFRSALKETREVRGENDIRVAWRMADLGRSLREAGELDEAEKLHQRALAMTRRLLEEDDVQVYWRLADLADTLRANDKLDEAETIGRDALLKAQRIFGTTHQEVAWSFWRLGEILQGKGESEEAEKCLRRSLALTRKIPAIENQIAWRLRDLVDLFRETGNLDEAEELAHEALAITDMKPLTRASIQIQLGGTMLRHKKHKEAESLLREAVHIRQEKLPNGHWLIENTRSLLGESLTGQAKFAEAEPILLDAWKGLQINSSAIPVTYRKIRIREALDRIIQLYETWEVAEPDRGHAEKAAEWRAKLTSAELLESNAPP